MHHLKKTKIIAKCKSGVICQKFSVARYAVLVEYVVTNLIKAHCIGKPQNLSTSSNFSTLVKYPKVLNCKMLPKFEHCVILGGKCGEKDKLQVI